LSKTRYKTGDIVLVKSCAGDVIPKIHVRLKERIVVEKQTPKRIGFKMSIEWPGYSGWNAEVVYQEEAETLRKNWSIPLSLGDETFVYDDCIVKKPRNPSLKNNRKIVNGNAVIRRKRKKS
jgi:hypothetical protein